MDTELLFAGIFALIVIGVALFLIMEVLEKIALPWHISQRPLKEQTP
jgi:NitT/TauT family transport system permease protein